MLHTTGVDQLGDPRCSATSRPPATRCGSSPRGAVGEPDDAGCTGGFALLRSFALPSYPDVRLTAARAGEPRGDPARLRPRCRPPRVAVRARLAEPARGRPPRHPDGRDLSDRHPRLRAALRHPARRAGAHAARRPHPQARDPDSRAVVVGDARARAPRRRAAATLGARRRRRAIPARRRAAPRGGSGTHRAARS